MSLGYRMERRTLDANGVESRRAQKCNVDVHTVVRRFDEGCVDCTSMFGFKDHGFRPLAEAQSEQKPSVLVLLQKV